MSTYYHELDRLTFQYQIESIAKEMYFRMSELIFSSREELKNFHDSIEKKSLPDEKKQSTVNYRFSSVLALIQTFRDAIKGALGEGFNLSSLEANVKHGELFRKLRNALVHDGYQPLGLWADGRYYIAANFKRVDQWGKTQFIDAPPDDIETLTLEFAKSYCTNLAKILEDLPAAEKLSGHKFSYEWMQAAWSHPSTEKFKSADFPTKERWA